MQSSAEVYYINGNFFVFSKSYAMNLRSKRIVTSLIGPSPKTPYQIAKSGLPTVLSHYSARIVLENKLATFKELRLRGSDDDSLSSRQKCYANKIKTMKYDARQLYVIKRTEELKKRAIEVTADRIGSLDEAKFKISVRDVPDHEVSNMLSKEIDTSIVSSLIRVEDEKMSLFRDVYVKGFYVTSGTRFGSDFLAYPRDPVRYHAQYAITLASGSKDKVDLSKISYNYINALHRLCHSANKNFLLATIVRDTESTGIYYWTLPTKTFLTADIDRPTLERFNLALPAEIHPSLIKTLDANLI